MKFENFDEVIRFAIDKEIEAAVFYEEASKNEVFAGSKEMFMDFSREERKHQKLLENLDKAQIAHFEPKRIPDLKRSDYMVEMVYHSGLGYAEILQIGMKREEKAHGLYADLAASTAKAEMVKLFQFLAQEEAKHKLALETLYDDYMAEMGD